MSDIQDEFDPFFNEGFQNDGGEEQQATVFDSLQVDPINIVNEPSSPNQSEGVPSSSVTFYTPNGSKFFIPEVQSEYIPVVGTVFNSVDEALVFYQSYAKKAGFAVRKYTAKHKANGELSHRLFVCNKQGKPNKKTCVDSLQPAVRVDNIDDQNDNSDQLTLNNTMNKPARRRRNSNIKVTDCYARIKLKLIDGTNKCQVYGFVEEHNHPLDIEQDKHFGKAQRQLEYVDWRFIQTVRTNNIGSVKAYRLRATLNGGYDKVRGTAVDYKNHQRDVNVFIGDRDAQMLIDKLSNRKLNNPELCFQYKTEDDELIGLFWADETSRCNYREFGDVLAFDATYHTNRYDMVFVPFTGVDHHNRCVTFGAGLLKYETIVSYEWLLKAFLSANPDQPKLVLTDQDAAMKEAIKNVMTESTHRLCMWHVMKKLPYKVCGDLLKNTDLRKRIHKLVWDVLLTKEKFESRWHLLINDFNLENNTWLSDQFNIRDRWVPGYFSDIPMCCLMKTTSRSESSNSFFHIFTDPDHTLVQFMVNFESAMEKQRHMHHELDYQTKTRSPFFVTELLIEQHAASVYTLTIFEKVQKEIYRGLYFCSIKFVSTADDTEVFQIQDVNQRSKVVSRHQVDYNNDANIVCSCNHYGRHGWLCRHVFCVLHNKRIDQIPETYIMRRWRRDILPLHLLDKRHRYGMENSETSSMLANVISDIEVIFSRLRNNPEQLLDLVEMIQKKKEDVLVETASQSVQKNKEDSICELLTVTVPDDVRVKPPTNIRNKGSGSHRKRLVGQDEKFVKKRKRQYRECKKCGEFQDDHDARNCDKIREKKLKEQKQKDKQKLKEINLRKKKLGINTNCERCTTHDYS